MEEEESVERLDKEKKEAKLESRVGQDIRQVQKKMTHVKYCDSVASWPCRPSKKTRTMTYESKTMIELCSS